jgi:hypothetical protein
MKNNNIQVFLNEDYGHKIWLWEPNMTEEEFVGWWSSLTETDIIKYFFNIRSLPGTIKPHPPIKETLPVTNPVNRMPGDPKSYLPYHYCHMNDIDDSFICIGTNRYPFQRTTRRDWKEQWIDWVLKNEPKDKSTVQVGE